MAGLMWEGGGAEGSSRLIPAPWSHLLQQWGEMRGSVRYREGDSTSFLECWVGAACKAAPSWELPASSPLYGSAADRYPGHKDQSVLLCSLFSAC